MSIYKIAKLTGFSPATVARALNNYGYCNAKTKKIIEEAAASLNYKSNSSARALRKDCTQRILCCIPDICNPFYFKTIEGISGVLEENGYYMMLYNSAKETEKEINAIRMLEQKYCDGLILISFDFNDLNIGALRISRKPVVLGNIYPAQLPDDNFDYIYVDHVKGMELATEHLIAKGCRCIMLVTGNINEQTSRERTDGYLNALKANDIKADGRYIINGSYEENASYQAVKDFLAKGLEVDGIIAGNDLSACGIISACRENGVRIPEDVKLVSFDNTLLATATSPTLTSVDMCQLEFGRCLATTLLDRINGRREVCNSMLDPKLIIRESAL